MKAKYVNKNPNHPGEVERDFQGRDNAEKWLSSFGLGKHDEHYIDGELVTEALRERREAYKQKILAKPRGLLALFL